MSKTPGPWHAFAILLFALLLTGADQAAAQAPGRFARDVQIRQLFHDAERRSFGLYVPSTYAPGRPAAVIIALHGRFSSAKAFHAASGLAAVAEARGALVIYPQMLGGFWGDGGHTPLGRREVDVDDVGFIAAAEASVAREYAVDSRQIYLVGYDTGGVLAWRAACQGQLRFAGVAVVSALMWDFTAQACADPPAPVPMLLIHGGRDENYPADGAAAGPGQSAHRLGTAETLATLRRVNGCPPGRDGAAFYIECSGAPLAWLPVARGANEWFRDGPGYRLDRHGFNAAEVIDRFFFGRAGFALPQSRDSRSSRAWLVYVPSGYDPARPTPLVLVLHGRPSNASAMASMSRMNAVAERRGFIVAYPEGLNNEWNAFYDLTAQRSIAPQDDVAFLKTLTEDLGQDLNIDRNRMFVSGFSNGGFMTIRMACSASDTFAGFASVGAELYTVLKDKCRGGRPAPILLMHGTDDPSVPYNGVVVRSGADDQETRVSLGARDTLAWFVQRNHCSQSGALLTFPIKGQSPGTTAQRFTPKDCTAPVAFYLINGGGHTWPGTGGVMNPEAFGPTNMDINASEEIWSFFSHLSLAEPAG
jgi:polyhydroxybutyrate depolymerase